MTVIARFVLLCAVLASWTSLGKAETAYPSKVVKLVVPQAPGGATDVFARKIGQVLSERWGQPVIVENRAGAAGVVGTDAVAKSNPDGYTLLVTYAGSQVVNPHLYANLPFDSINDFKTVATLASTPFILVTNPKLPVATLKEYVALAKEKPGVLTFASSGNGSINQLLGEMLKVEAGIDMRHVPYRGVAPALGDVIAGHVDSAFSSVPSVLGMIKGGQVRPLAVSSAKRIAAAPDVPTIIESGYPNVDVSPWWGILAPARVDAGIVKKINADVNDILKTEAMNTFLAGQGAQPLIMSPEAFLDLMTKDLAAWSKVIKAANIKLE